MLIPGDKRQETNGLGWDLLLASNYVLLLPFSLRSPFPPSPAAKRAPPPPPAVPDPFRGHRLTWQGS